MIKSYLASYIKLHCSIHLMEKLYCNFPPKFLLLKVWSWVDEARQWRYMIDCYFFVRTSFSSSKKRKILCHVTNVMQPVFVFLRNELYHYSPFSVVVPIYVYVFLKKNHRNMRPWLQKHLSLSLWSHFFPTEASTASAFPRSGCTKQFFSFSHLIPLLNAFKKDLEVETLRITYKKICRLEASS